MAGANLPMREAVEATFRLWHSSPRRSPSAIISVRSIGSLARIALSRAGPHASASHSSLSSVWRSLEPNRSARPRPSFSGLNARLEPASATTTTGIRGLTIPAMAPTQR